MTIDKPTLDRHELLAEEARRRRCERVLRQAVGELGKDEYLGIPVRRAAEIVIPILKREAGRAGVVDESTKATSEASP